MLPNVRSDFSRDQVVAVHLYMKIFKAGLPCQPKKLSSDERIEPSLCESSHGFLNSALQRWIFRVMPQKLPVQVLQQHPSARPAHADQFSNRTLFFLEVLKQHPAI